MSMFRKYRRNRGPVYRTGEGRGGLVFTADDFPQSQGGGGNNPPAGGGGGQPAPNTSGTPAPPANNQPDRDPRFDFEVEVVGPDGQPIGQVSANGRPAGQPSQQQPAQQGGQNVLDMVLEGENVPANLRGRRVSDLASALAALESLPRTQPQQQPMYQPQPAQQPPEVQFTEEDFGVTADPAKFQQKLQQMMGQYAEQRLAPLQLQTLATQSILMGQNARTSLKYYDLFRDEIENDARQQPINVTANPMYWQSVHDRLVRENITKVIQHEQSKTPPKPQPGQAERSNGSSAQTVNTSQPGKPQLTTEELRLCQATGVSPQEYVFYRDRY